MLHYPFDVHRVKNVSITFSPEKHPTPWLALLSYDHPILHAEYYTLGLYETYDDAHQAIRAAGLRQAVQRREQERLQVSGETDTTPEAVSDE